MQERTKRFTVAIAGLALAGGAVLAAAPAAEAATVTGTTTTVAGSTAAGWGHDDDRYDRRGDHGHGRHWKKRWKKRHHGHGHHRSWRDHGRYSSYHEAYLIGQRYRGSSWESFNCDRVGGYWVLRVYG